MSKGRSTTGSTEWLVRESAPTKLLSRKVRIEITAGPDVGRKIESVEPEVRVGSAAGCHLVVSDPTVSRHHFTVRVEADRIRVTDAGSTNGTFVDGLAILDAYARPDSQITVGNTSLRLAMLPEMVEVPLSSRERFGALFGRSPVMRRVFAILERIAPTDTTLLVEGETGTGKDLVAEAVHEESLRGSGPFVVFDCSAVSASLIESELFGHVRGAFTGAVAERAGAFEAADGGTLFLDEVGELPLNLQPKLLRALERREVRRVGSNEGRRVDVRIIAATNRALTREVERGHFREDLYYRLAVVLVTMPPLRERAEDIPFLVEQFARELGGAAGPRHLPPDLAQVLSAQTFPGNVRQLRNAVARTLSLGSQTVEPTAAPPAGSPSVMANVDLTVPLKASRDRLIEDFEQAYLTTALQRAGGSVSKAATIAGVNRRFIQRALKRTAR